MFNRFYHFSENLFKTYKFSELHTISEVTKNPNQHEINHSKIVYPNNAHTIKPRSVLRSELILIPCSKIHKQFSEFIGLLNFEMQSL